LAAPHATAPLLFVLVARFGERFLYFLLFRVGQLRRTELNRQLRDSWAAGSGRPAMRTKMTDADWITVFRPARMMSVFAESEQSIVQERVHAGLARAKDE
jgi:hypothetical protein